ncbi:MAG: NUDIX hydrolase [Porticoccaceae bacterium]|nr:NUDIX hydrolase [Porticoccaceae bacterium]
MVFHPKPGEHGKPVKLSKPSTPTPLDAWADPNAFAQVVPQGPMPEHINGVPISSWTDAPTTNEGWEALVSNLNFEEPDFKPVAGLKPAAGVVTVEPDGRVWAFAPSNAYGGYTATFPKGRLDGLSTRAAAIKEAYEETGLRVELIGFLVDVLRTTTCSRYYLARRIGGNPADMGWEAQAVMLLPAASTASIIDHPSDKPILKALSHAPLTLQPCGQGS